MPLRLVGGLGFYECDRLYEVLTFKDCITPIPTTDRQGLVIRCDTHVRRYERT